MSILHSNINHLLFRARIRVGRLANICDMQQPTLFRILGHPDREPRMSTVKPIANLLGVEVSELVSKDLKTHIDKVVADNPFSWCLRQDRSIPVEPIVVKTDDEQIKSLNDRIKKLEETNTQLLDALIKLIEKKPNP
jgi:hypothetical protein